MDYVERLDDNPRYSDRISPLTADWSGNLYDFYTRIASRLTADVKTPFALDKEMYRIDDTPVHKAIRECLANTLVHADFYGRRGIVIEKRFRHITFANPGIFRVPLEVAISGGTSDARNDVLFTLFALVEIGEKLGTGLVQLFALWEKNGWPLPELHEQFDPERTVLTLDYNDAEDEAVKTNIGPESSEKMTESSEKTAESSEKTTESSEKTSKKILNLLNQDSLMTTAVLSSILGISERAVSKQLKNLQVQGRLRRVGPDKGGHWEVLEEN